jgi:hypothetical protein
MPAKKLSGTALRDAVTNDYLAGALVSQLMNRYGISRSYTYQLLKESGRVPRRFGSEEESTDLMLNALRAYVQQLESENANLRAQLGRRAAKKFAG